MANSKISFIVVVNTEDVTVEVNENVPLHVVAQQALQRSESKDRSLGDFELKDARGTVLDQSKKVEDYGFSSPVKLFLTLRVGVQG